MKITNESGPGRARLDELENRRAGAADLAVSALVFLARDMERIERFLALTGIDPGALRARAQDRGLQLAVLDHIAGDEALLLLFAQEEGLAPEAIGRARHALGGGDFGD